MRRAEKGVNRRFVHVSFDLVDQFIPRVPEQRVEGKFNEEAKTKRICVSGDIHKAVKGIPQFAQVLRYMDKLGLPLLIHAYYLESGNVYKPSVYEVLDVGFTDEFWILERPAKVLRKDYLITNYDTIQETDPNGFHAEFINHICFRPVPFQDNYKNLCELFHVDSSKLPQNVLFRTFLLCCGEELLQLKSKY